MCLVWSEMVQEDLATSAGMVEAAQCSGVVAVPGDSQHHRQTFSVARSTG